VKRVRSNRGCSLVPVLFVEFCLVEGLIVERPNRRLGRRFRLLRLSLGHSGSLIGRLCVRAFARRRAARIERDILLLEGLVRSIGINTLNRTDLVHLRDIVRVGDASVSPSLCDHREVRTHHRASHRSSGETRNIVAGRRGERSEGGSGGMAEERADGGIAKERCYLHI